MELISSEYRVATPRYRISAIPKMPSLHLKIMIIIGNFWDTPFFWAAANVNVNPGEIPDRRGAERRVE
jgi:hypothetical protein